ncbi:MAG: GLUG motif-containing protein [Sedimentisphaerales bacterium]|jgi:hypothetical protein
MKARTTFTLSLAAILTLTICSAFGSYSGGSGEPNNPYQIANVADFNQLTSTPTDWTKAFILTADINLTGRTFTKAPIAPDTSTTYGFQGTPFTGIFDGNSHTISKLTITASTKEYIGLFGYVGSSGQIRNLGVKDVNTTGSQYVGGLVGSNGDWSIGGAAITSCYATGSVSGTYYVGGMVGSNYYGTLTSCYATCTVSGTVRVGGLVGYNYHSTLTSCYATGAVSGISFVGGLVGNIASGSLTSCYATGSVNGTSLVGGLVGLNDDGALTSCFWDINTSGQPTSSGGTGKTTAEMKTLSTFTSAGWDFSYTDGDPADWFMPIDEYPILTWQISPADLYTDGKNNFRDWAIFAKYWLREDCAIYNDYCEWADMNFDGYVDISDLADFVSYWLEEGIY